jgi:hypothetical protein
VPTLRAIRRSQSAFDPLFFEKSPLFWPIARAAHAFANDSSWPEVSTYSRVFESEAEAIRFELATPQPRRHRRTAVDPGALYDARITERACVPTRERSWHDFLNALVWGTFPRAKRVLHERQHRAITSRMPPAATRLPGARSREHDALALIDEGGVILIAAPGKRVGVVFGHALYEGLVLGVQAMVARAVHVQVEAIPAEVVYAADKALEERLQHGELVPEVLPRIALAELAALSP